MHCLGWCQINDPTATVWLHKLCRKSRPFICSQVSFSTVSITQAQTHIAVYSKFPPKLSTGSISNMEGLCKLTWKDVIFLLLFKQARRGLFHPSSIMLKTRKSTKTADWYDLSTAFSFYFQLSEGELCWANYASNHCLGGWTDHSYLTIEQWSCGCLEDHPS